MSQTVADGQARQPLVCHSCGYRPPDGEDRTTCPADGLVLVPKAEHDGAPEDPYLGRTIAGKYAVVGIVGAGGMGAVYRAIQRPVGRAVALKVIRSAGGDRRSVQRRFEKEAKVVAGLEHPNTVTLHDFGIHEDGTLYMVLELVRGRPLSTEIEGGPMPYAWAAWVVAEVLDALVEAHDLGLVHRDLKPANIMLVRTRWGDQAVKVLDFGIAKAVGGDATAADQLTQTGMVCGTPRYMAPEQVTGKKIDARTDLYAIGVVLWTCLTGRAPFEADNTFELLLAHRQRPVPTMDPALGVPEALVAAVERALAKGPDDRFPDARTMAQALRTAAGIQAGTEVPPTALAESPVEPATATRPAAPAALHHAETELGAPAGGTPIGMAAEVVPTEPGGRSLRPVAVAAVLCMIALTAAGAWLVATRDSGRPQGAGTVRPAATKPAAGERAAADRATSSEAHYGAAAAHAQAGRVGPALAALEAYLALAPNRQALEARLQADGDFDRVRDAPAFRAWAGAPGTRGASTPRGAEGTSQVQATDGGVERAGSADAKGVSSEEESRSGVAPEGRKRRRKARGPTTRRRVKPPRDPGAAVRKGVEMEEF